MTKSDREGGSSFAGAAEVEPMAERDAEGGAGCFPCPKDVTDSGFLVCVSEGVGEASVTYHRSKNAKRQRDPDGLAFKRMSRFTDLDGVFNLAAYVQDVFDRNYENERRAHGPAVKSVRQFCVRWSLTKMWTFTFKTAQWDKKLVKSHMNAFLMRWRMLNGGKPFPYVYVIELHPEGHGYHVHVGVPGGMFTDFFQLRRVWGHGRIRFDQNSRHSGESRNDARRLAIYLSKYLAKDVNDDHAKGNIGMNLRRDSMLKRLVDGFPHLGKRTRSCDSESEERNSIRCGPTIRSKIGWGRQPGCTDPTNQS